MLLVTPIGSETGSRVSREAEHYSLVMRAAASSSMQPVRSLLRVSGFGSTMDEYRGTVFATFEYDEVGNIVKEKSSIDVCAL